MIKEWHELIQIIGDKPLIIEKVRLRDSDIIIEGNFELPTMAKLPIEDQVFAAAFIKFHGSIKQMEKAFGVSYPTIKNRLNRISEKLELINIDVSPAKNEVLEQINAGEISVEEALEKLKKKKI